MFGDVHFSSINPWNEQAGENFIRWFDKQDFGDKNEIEALFAGDISERDTNPGKVIDQMWRLFNIASKKFRKVHVCVGNHDKKLYHNNEQHSLIFLSNFENVIVYEKETIINTDTGYKVLMLPWQRMEDVSVTLTDYYNNLSSEFTEPTYDVVIGHWQIKEQRGLSWMQDGVDISKFKAKCYAIGHVHTRIRDEYLGSVFPNSVSEQNDSYPRGYKVYENGVESFVTIPKFLKYVEIKYGDTPKPEEPGCAYTYVITNCSTEIEAKEKYPTLAVRGIERPQSNILVGTQVNVECGAEGDSIQNITSTYITDLTKAFSDMVRETNLTISRTTFSYVKNLLTKPSNNRSE